MNYIIKFLIVAIGLLFGIGYSLKHIFHLKRRTENLQEAIEDLKLIQEVAKEITVKLEMKDLLPEIMNAFVKAGNVKKGSLMLYNKEKDLLEIKESVGLSERAVEGVKLKIGEGIAGRVAKTGRSVLINDTTEDSIYKDFFSGDPKGRPRETLLSLPLIFREEVLGIVTLNSKVTGKQFIRNDERLLSILASQAAVSINNARMYEMAITDGLTKFYIHRHFLHRIEQEVEKAKRYDRSLSLLFLDIDHFKEFNDTYGHQMGDEALIHLSRIIRAQTRTVDICARYGGEEFVIILPETPKSEALIIAERLRKDIQQSSFMRKDKEHKITVSIGVAQYSKKMVSSQKFIEEADRFLYQAKEKGRNRIVG